MPEGNLSFPSFLAERLRQSPCQIIVTGGSGWIGQATLELLESAFGDDLAQRLSVFGSADRRLRLRSGRDLLCRELAHINQIGDGPTLFVHYAFLTKDRLHDRTIEAFEQANEKISALVAQAIRRVDARGAFVPSSGAVYKKGTSIIDGDLATNPYGAMKIRDERRFGELAAKKNMPLCMPRLFNLAGPFINKHDMYALASIIKAALAGQAISIRAAHRVVRSYIHVADLVTLAFAMLLDARPGDQAVFDTAGDEALELGELAERVRVALGHPDLPIHRPPRIEGSDDIYVGDGRVMLKMQKVRELAVRDFTDQIRDTATFMQASADGLCETGEVAQA